MSTFRTSSGQWFRSGIGGTYPINDGDPQNDEEFDQEVADREYDSAMDNATELTEEWRNER